jgi:mRNA interferase RelE/StbE
MAYNVKVMSQAEKQLDGLASIVRLRVVAALRRLADDPRPHGCKKLKAGLGWSLRVGEYRVIYLIDDEEGTVGVTWIGARGAAYRGN